MRTLRKLALRTFNSLFTRNKLTIGGWILPSQAISNGLACLSRLTPAVLGREEEARYFLNELDCAEEIRAKVEYFVEHYGHLPFSWSWGQRLHGKQFSRVLFLYLLLRFIKPDKVVETGCFSGWTSTLILFALHKNEKGHLWTIDIPAEAGLRSMSASLPPELSPGFLIPETLRQKWTLILGDTREHLVPLLQRLGTIDVFYHDSDHTYEHMMWEYTSAWPHLSSGGVLISDDIANNTAFWDFATALRRPMAILTANPNFGAISKDDFALYGARPD